MTLEETVRQLQGMLDTRVVQPGDNPRVWMEEHAPDPESPLWGFAESCCHFIGSTRGHLDEGLALEWVPGADGKLEMKPVTIPREESRSGTFGNLYRTLKTRLERSNPDSPSANLEVFKSLHTWLQERTDVAFELERQFPTYAGRAGEFPPDDSIFLKTQVGDVKLLVGVTGYGLQYAYLMLSGPGLMTYVLPDRTLDGNVTPPFLGYHDIRDEAGQDAFKGTILWVLDYIPVLGEALPVFSADVVEATVRDADGNIKGVINVTRPKLL